MGASRATRAPRNPQGIRFRVPTKLSASEASCSEAAVPPRMPAYLSANENEAWVFEPLNLGKVGMRLITQLENWPF